MQNTRTFDQLKEETIRFIGAKKYSPTIESIAARLNIDETLTAVILDELKAEGRIHLWIKDGYHYWMISTPKK